VSNPRLREYVQERLSGSVRRPDGTVVAGPKPPAWKGLNKPHRQDRRWATAWSPEQVSHRLRIDFADDESMRISHEAIYQALFIEGRGALKREVVACVRTGRALREPRARSQSKPQGHVTAEVVISQRPAEADDRAVPGHWEGDLIIGTGRSAIGAVVERASRSTLLVHLPRLDGWGETPPTKNGPALGGYGAIAMNAALTASMTQLPEQLRKTLTWDRGKELSAHAQFALDTGTKVYFADPTPHGSDPRTRTRTGYYVSTSRKAPTCRGGPPTTSTPSPWRATTGPARFSAGVLRPRCSRSSYARPNRPVLQRQVELELSSVHHLSSLLERQRMTPDRLVALRSRAKRMLSGPVAGTDDMAMVDVGTELVAADPRTAARLFRRAARIAESAGRWSRVAGASEREVAAWIAAGRTAQATAAAERAKQAVTRILDDDTRLRVVSNLAASLKEVGLADHAIDLLEDVIAQRRDEVDRTGDRGAAEALAAGLVNLGVVMIDQGHGNRGIELLSPDPRTKWA
jgi:hypothetical protein